jgi:Holliday junction resolvasome RuvABC endonuclease subunit
VKRCITGKGSADKATVAAMLRQLLPPVVFTAVDAAADTTDALAVALTRAEVRRSPLLAAQWVAELDAAAAVGRRHQR